MHEIGKDRIERASMALPSAPAVTRRTLIRALGVTVPAVFLAACGVQPAPTPAATQAAAPTAATTPQAAATTVSAAAKPAAAGQTTLTFWHSFTTGAQADAWKQLVADFEQANPQFKMETEATAWADTVWMQKVTTAVAGGAPPDGMIERAGSVQYSVIKAIRPLDDYMKSSNIDPTSYFYKFYMDVNVLNDQYWGIPWAPDIVLLYLNRAHLQEAGLPTDRGPKDWAEQSDWDTKLTKTDSSGKIIQLGHVPDYGGAIRLTQYVYANDGWFFSPDYLKATYDSPKDVEALEWYVAQYDKHGGVEKVAAFSDSVGQGAQGAPFLAGKLSMFPTYDYFAAQVKQFAPNLDYLVVPMPGNVGAQHRAQTGSNHINMFQGTKYPDEIWKFINFMIQKPQQIFWFKSTGSISANVDAMASPEFQASPTMKLIKAEQDSNPRNYVFHPLIQSFAAAERSTATDLALHHKMTAKDALIAANKNVQANLDSALGQLKAQGYSEIKFAKAE